MATSISVSDGLTERGRAAIARAGDLLRQIEDARPPFTRESVVDRLNELHLELANAGTESSLLSETHPDGAVREAAEAVARETEQFRTSLMHSRGLYDALGGVPEGELDDVSRRAVTLVRQDMKRAGVELSDGDRERVRALRDELVLIEQEFARNIRDDVRTVELEPAQLDGLPPDYVATHAPGADGKVRVTTDYPDYIPFMSYATDGDARKALLFASHERAVPRNLEVLDQMLAKRHELATLLGYGSWADLATEDKMAASAKTVREFIKRAYDATRESGAAELAELIEHKRRDEADATTIGDWELSYYLEQVKRERLSFDARAVRPYFEYRAVRQAIIDLSSELFGLTFTPVDVRLWHDSVETFDVSVDGVPMGRISLDMHPRDGKFKHAACFTYRVGLRGRQKPHGVLVCNFPDPDAQSGPALMDHREVVTYFHEFGHLVHNIVSGDAPLVRTARVAEWDFIEAPSQFLEEWIYDFDVLRRFARHVETGETIPAELVERLRAARDFGRGVHVQRQLYFSALALHLHDRDPKGMDTTEVCRRLADEYAPSRPLEGTHFQASFGHLEGYTSSYYTYMWSLVLAKDFLSAFPNGLMDTQQTRRYRDLILARGGSKPAAELVEDFLGRPYGFESFREWLAPKAA